MFEKYGDFPQEGVKEYEQICTNLKLKHGSDENI